MAPKFRGDGDDWLDNDAPKGGAGKRANATAAKKKGGGRAAALAPSEANATVAEVYPKLCLARMDDGSGDLLCSYRRATVFGEQGLHNMRERTPVAVGDRVKVAPSGSRDGVVDGVCARRNSLARPAPGTEGKDLVHVIAANVDLLVIVASAEKPVFTPGLVDRFLVAAQAAGIRPLICVNKLDLLPEGGARQWEIYRPLGFEVIETSSKLGSGIEGLRARLQGLEAVFCGQSGVGKTSLINALTGTSEGRVAEVSDATGKGKHTTTGARLLDVPDAAEGTRWIDTPGVREFGLYGIEPDALHKLYPDLRCADADCTHSGETSCTAQGQPRFASYQRILESLRAGER